MPAALDGLRIVDFSRVLAGPLATMVLADLGAEVTKIERPQTGDDTRAWGPPHDDHGRASYFESVNRNKRSVTLDLKLAAGRERAIALCDEADVLVENFRPGVMDRLGLGYEQLSHQNPRLIYCSITGFGTKAGAELPGYDLLVQALGGLMSISGEADRPPVKTGVAVVDVICGLFASTAILAALHHRDATGEGQRIELDLLTCLLAGLANQSSAYTVAGVTPRRIGNRHPSIAPYEVLPTASGEIALAVGNDGQFAALCEVLGLPELPGRPQYATNTARVEHREALAAELTAALAASGAEHWTTALSARGVPAGPVNDIAQAFALAERLGLRPTVEIEREDGSSVTLPRNPISMSRTPPTYRSAPPDLGETPPSAGSR